jgi:ABC-2 type transport system ATP-binding protein
LAWTRFATGTRCSVASAICLAISSPTRTSPASSICAIWRACAGGVNRTFEGLAKRLDLDLAGRFGALSHGNRQKVGILHAFMHEPEILILDEPTSGLDPLVQREFLELVRETRREGRTVFLSSHILYEVEAVTDVVAMISAGRLLVEESVGKLKAQALRIDLTFEGQPPVMQLQNVPEVRDVRVAGSTVHLVVEGSTADLIEVAAPYRVHQVAKHEPDLEEVFLRYYERKA